MTGDRIAIFSKGDQQVSEPMEVYRRPRTLRRQVLDRPHHLAGPRGD